MDKTEQIVFRAAARAEQRRGLLDMLQRIPASDSFARMMVLGKIKALDREPTPSQPQKGEK